MKVRIYRWYNAVLTALLSMLGYGCSLWEEPMDEYGVLVEYGMPTADFIVKGTVTDEAGAPVEGIKTMLKMIPEDYPEYAYGIDSTMTDATGKFQVETRGAGLYGQKLIVEDIDGEANGGAFLSDTIDVSKLEAKQVSEGDKHWYEGKYEVSVDVKLKKK